jgi:hypothetical protein
MALMLARVPRLPFSLDPLIAEAKRRARQRRLLIALSVLLLAVLAAGLVSAFRSPGGGSSNGGALAGTGQAHTGADISQSSIAGVSLGLQRSDYERLFGRKALQGIYRAPETLKGIYGASRVSLSYLDWYGHRFAAYFGPAGGGAILIDTWNKAYRTAAGVGPGTPVARLKAVYGERLRQSPLMAPDAYELGSHLVFAVDENDAYVSSVALYRGPTRQYRYRNGVGLPFAADVARSCTGVGGCS